MIMPGGVICGSSVPEVGTRVPMRRQLHDNGFGHCFVFVTGLYGESEERFWCSFVEMKHAVWQPTDIEAKSLAWLERRIKTWDKAWPEAKWCVRLAWPWQSETWDRIKPGVWFVSKIGPGLA